MTGKFAELYSVHMDTSTSSQEVNLAIYDGDVRHDEINGAIATAEKSILSGEQTRLPHFPEDQRLLKLHSGHPLVLLFWEVLKKVPEHVRPDRAPGYRQLVAEPASMGETARQELHQVIGLHRLRDADDSPPIPALCSCTCGPTSAPSSAEPDTKPSGQYPHPPGSDRRLRGAGEEEDTVAGATGGVGAVRGARASGGWGREAAGGAKEGAARAQLRRVEGSNGGWVR